MVRNTGLVPVGLILKGLIEENLFELFDSLIAEKLRFGLWRSPLLRLAMLGFKSASFPVWP